MDETTLLTKRFTELCNRAENTYSYTNTEFLNLNEQNILNNTVSKYKFTLYGGYESAERKIAFFGNEESCGYSFEPPIVCIEIKPVNEKFADNLTHRDFLGALMNLGIKREMLGDIIINENTGYILCIDNISLFITENLINVKHTKVKCKPVDRPPENSTGLPDAEEFVVASLRCDAVISAVYNLSRNECKKYFEQNLVFKNSECITSVSDILNQGDIISVRGKGRFKFDGEKAVTKKNKLRILVRVFH